MENTKLPPKATVHLTRWTAEKFDEIVNESRAVLGHASQKHGVDFVINLLNHLSDTVYLVVDSLTFGLNLNSSNKSIIKDMDKQMGDIAKMMENYKPPKVGED